MFGSEVFSLANARSLTDARHPDCVIRPPSDTSLDGRSGHPHRHRIDAILPDCPGLYAFSVQDVLRGQLRVCYVGLTSNLWMVTKGMLPGYIARGGQRYGRPKHAGATRKRINVELAKAHTVDLEVTHWLKPVVIQAGADMTNVLRTQEEELIVLWELRKVGWNRG